MKIMRGNFSNKLAAIFLSGIFTTMLLHLNIAVSAEKGGEPMSFTINSTAFKEGGTIPKQYSCDGADISPQLSLEGAPAGTRSFALIMDDPDAPVGTFNHWVLYDLPGDTKGLSEGIPKEPTLPNGAKQGITSFRRIGYGGPCPPKGPAHRYFFTIYALDVPTLGPGPRASKDDVEKNMKGHIIGKAVIMGKYGR